MIVPGNKLNHCVSTDYFSKYIFFTFTIIHNYIYNVQLFSLGREKKKVSE